MPLDEYPKRCVEQLANWHQELESYKRGERIEVKPSREYASTIMNAIWTGEPSVVYGNVRNDNLIDNLPQGCCVEVACRWTPTASSRPKWARCRRIWRR
nr:Alpha-galactosidase [Klebsiella pneumoniae]